MKKIFLSLLFITSIIQLKAQSVELSVQGNGGLSGYVGGSTVSTTFLNGADPADHTGYPNGDGNRFTFSYGADIQLQGIFKSNFILGVQAGYEILGSKTNINGVYEGNGGETPATGYATQHDGYFNFNPYIGYRLNVKKVRFDILPGFDFAFGTHESNTINVTASDNTYYNAHTDNVYFKPSDDIRLRLGLAAYYQKFGITANYSYGLVNFNAGELADAIIPSERRDVFSLGISYRLK